MEVILAEHAGFCFGVTRAVDVVYDQIKKNTDKKIYTYGPIIHNETVVADLEKQGVSVIEGEEELKSLTEGILIIRSHGIRKEIYEIMKERGIEYIDATCPFVKRIHNIVEKESAEGKTIVVVGSAKHPEVDGIVSYASGPVYVVESPDEALDLDIPEGTDICIVSQTTFNTNKFQETVDKFSNTRYNVNVVNTICSATEERQTEAERIAGQVDAMIVIGGAHSSNSRKLYEICSKKCANTYFIQTLDDLHLELPKAVKLVGITAGASTPKNIIEEVQNHVRTIF
ncbi:MULTISPECIES: 4-hydroxy-3-methylbut-2-enyl diphosphate reductase [unclassified Butyrivibrio]|uniref:4-hydroxy-3-methylbut-2-enyl diphosphate reductase n=1 Tax=unclassified Butyrivibrio TaxID=2639466 RepID=UPI000414AEF5|nr:MULTISPECIES: 4-hydroxy-3-methylbut-2-enyl diphosphate reductase [unclassified Butyrivibrio]MCR5342383.1 4-hydroxy-3-methylbut-2-enyl diphosphate reductase [Butyrivibrio sp.]